MPICVPGIVSAHANEKQIRPPCAVRGIGEYLVWLTLEKRVRWFHLVEQEYVEQKDQGGRLTSKLFLGLVPDVRALLKFDRAKVIAGLRNVKGGK